MFKVLIVDDEPIVREGLKTIIDWEQYGFSVCGEGVDGNDGLNKMLTMNPQLVLLDIKMPGMYGIDVIKEARQRGFNGRVIILTGYSDFEYAKSAIGFGVKSYLLKPIDEDELIIIVKNLRKEIEEQQKTEKYLSISKKHLKGRVINDLISCEQLPENIKEDMEICNLCFDYSSFQVAVIEENNMDKHDKSHLGIRIGEVLADNKDIEAFSMDGGTVIIFKGKGIEEIQRCINNVYKAMENGTENRIFTAVGRRVSSVEEIHLSYKDVKKIMVRRFLYGDQRIVYWESVEAEIISGKSLERFDTESLFTSIEVGDLERLSEILGEMEIQFKQSILTTEKIKGLCANCFIELKERVTLNYTEHKNILPYPP